MDLHFGYKTIFLKRKEHLKRSHKLYYDFFQYTYSLFINNYEKPFIFEIFIDN